MQDGLNRHFLLRKLHSLTGLLPVGFFLLFHIWENSLSRRDHQAEFGAGYYNEHVVKFINDMNYIRFIEVLLMGSILFHGIYGGIVWWQGRNNVKQYNYLQNWGYFLQRITALATFAFIAYHVTTTRFAGDAVTGNLFAHMATTLQNPVAMLIYMAGILVSAFHLA
jgi:succinate dehydrogenase / fumarate reductase cytochrome b subunit